MSHFNSKHSNLKPKTVKLSVKIVKFAAHFSLLNYPTFQFRKFLPLQLKMCYSIEYWLSWHFRSSEILIDCWKLVKNKKIKSLFASPISIPGKVKDLVNFFDVVTLIRPFPRKISCYSPKNITWQKKLEKVALIFLTPRNILLDK